MKRLVALAVLLAACASPGVQGGVATTAPQTSTSPSTSAPASSAPTTAPDRPAPQPDHERELAPDFELLLADGDTFTLSEAGRPVYLIFWAEWCPVCRKELPIIDEIASRYADRVDFIAPAWRSVPESAVSAAAELMPSGAIRWGLDNEEVIFGLYGVPYQPVTVLIAADGTVFDQWAGVRGAEDIIGALDELLEIPPA